MVKRCVTLDGNMPVIVGARQVAVGLRALPASSTVIAEWWPFWAFCADVSVVAVRTRRCLRISFWT